MLRKLLLSRLLLTLSFTVVYPQTSDDSKEVEQLQIQLVRFDDEAKQSTENLPVFESLSEKLKIPVADLQQDKEETGFGFGQLFIAHSLAQASGQPFDALAEQFKAGKGWGVIAKENNLKLGPVVSSLKRAGNDLKVQRIERIRAEKTERVRAEKTERMRAERANKARQQGVSRPRGPVGGSKAKGGGPHR